MQTRLTINRRRFTTLLNNYAAAAMEAQMAGAVPDSEGAAEARVAAIRQMVEAKTLLFKMAGL